MVPVRLGPLGAVSVPQYKALLATIHGREGRPFVTTWGAADGLDIGRFGQRRTGTVALIRGFAGDWAGSKREAAFFAGIVDTDTTAVFIPVNESIAGKEKGVGSVGGGA